MEEKRVPQEQKWPQEWRKSFYDRWVEKEGIPVVRDLAVSDLKEVEVAPWARLEARGAYLCLTGGEETNDAQILEIPPGGTTAPDRHMFEKYIFVVSGRGATEVWNHEGSRHTFEWQTGSLFSIPLNCFHRHSNGSGRESVRFLQVTTGPLVFNLFHNLEFMFNCPFDFRDRFDGRETFFSGEGTSYPGRIWETNFVADVYNFKLMEWPERGAGGKNITFEFANNAMASHISQFPVGTYKKGHRHGPGAHVVILSGVGYSLMWRDEDKDWNDIHWKPGSLLVPPGLWWHQHFNTGPEPARYMAIRWGGAKWYVTRYLNSQGIDASAKEGGNQIEYEDQDPRVHQFFIERCARNGVTVNMDAFNVRTS